MLDAKGNNRWKKPCLIKANRSPTQGFRTMETFWKKTTGTNMMLKGLLERFQKGGE